MATSVEWTHCQKALPPLGFWQRVLSPSQGYSQGIHPKVRQTGDSAGQNFHGVGV